MKHCGNRSANERQPIGKWAACAAAADLMYGGGFVPNLISPIAVVLRRRVVVLVLLWWNAAVVGCNLLCWLINNCIFDYGSGYGLDLGFGKRKWRTKQL